MLHRTLIFPHFFLASNFRLLNSNLILSTLYSATLYDTPNISTLFHTKQAVIRRFRAQPSLILPSTA